jgi:hypothetical protein
MPRYWIQKALRAHKKGSLHRQLGVPQSDNLPMMLLRRIASAPLGTRIRNPTEKGKRVITVTPLLKKRAVLALNLKTIRQ